MLSHSKVSVVLPVYNGERFVKQAIESLLNQTFTDFEIIIINDGSIDSSEEIIKYFLDQRIKYYRNRKNLGLPRTLNKALKLCKGEYVARMDADDVSHPTRLEIQSTFLDSHKDVDICGSAVEIATGNSKTVTNYPLMHDDLKARLLFRTCFAHPSIMFRSKKMLENKLFYDINFKYSEDYELWTRSCSVVRFANVPEILLSYRQHDSQRSKHQKEHSKFVSLARERMVIYLGINYSNEELKIHNLIASMDITDEELILKCEEWLWKIYSFNQMRGNFNNRSLKNILGEQWFSINSRRKRLDAKAIIRYVSSGLFRHEEHKLNHFGSLLLKYANEQITN